MIQLLSVLREMEGITTLDQLGTAKQQLADITKTAEAFLQSKNQPDPPAQSPDAAMTSTGSENGDRRTQSGDEDDLSDAQLDKMISALSPRAHTRLAARLTQVGVQSEEEEAGLPPRAVTRSRSDHRI